MRVNGEEITTDGPPIDTNNRVLQTTRVKLNEESLSVQPLKREMPTGMSRKPGLPVLLPKLTLLSKRDNRPLP
jgi:hypothetical protein